MSVYGSLTERTSHDQDASSTDPAEIAAEIERTRNELGGTIGAIQDQLAPERIADQAIEVTEQARDAAKEVVGYAIGEVKLAISEMAGQASTAVRGATIGKVETMAASTRDSMDQAKTGLMATIKANPLPAALTGIGLAWLWNHRAGASGSDAPRDPGYQSYGQYGSGPSSMNQPYTVGGYGASPGGQNPDNGQSGIGQAASQAKDAVGQVSDQAQGIVGQVVDQVQGVVGAAGHAVGSAGHMVGHAPGNAVQMGSQAKGAVWQALDKNPMAVGALGAVVGGIAALMFPSTEKEGELMGAAKEQMMEKVQTTATETMDKVKQVAGEAQGTIMEEAEKQGLIPEAGDASS